MLAVYLTLLLIPPFLVVGLYSFTRRFFHPTYPPVLRGKIPPGVDKELMLPLPHYENYRGKERLRVKVRTWVPENTSGRGVVFIHGWESSMGYFHLHIEHFLKKGYHIAAIDGVSHGESDYIEIISLVNFADAVDTTIQWFRKEYPITHLTLWGHSLGGVASTIGVGSGMIGGVDRMVIEGIFANTNYIIKRYIEMMHIPRVVARYFLWMVKQVFLSTVPEGHPLKGKIGDMDEFSPDRQLPNIEVPYILLHARNDHVVDFKEFELLSSIGSPNFRAVALEEGNHFTTHYIPGYFELVDKLLSEI